MRRIQPSPWSGTFPTGEMVHGRRRFLAFTTEPHEQGHASTLIDRCGPIFQCFKTPAEVGANYLCAQICDNDGNPTQELRAKVVRSAPLKEIRAVLKQHPNSKTLRLQTGYWYEIHAD